MKTGPPRRPNPLRGLIATAPNPKRPNHVPDPKAFTSDEPPTVRKGSEHIAALLVRYYGGSSSEDQGRILKYAEECFNRNQG